MYIGCLPIVYAVMPGFIVPMVTRILGTHLLQKRFFYFRSRMIKRVEAYIAGHAGRVGCEVEATLTQQCAYC